MMQHRRITRPDAPRGRRRLRKGLLQGQRSGRGRGEATRLELTAVFRKVPEGYIGFVEELPGANTQGSTLEETRANLREAVLLVLEANRTLAKDLGIPDP